MAVPDNGTVSRLLWRLSFPAAGESFDPGITINAYPGSGMLKIHSGNVLFSLHATLYDEIGGIQHFRQMEVRTDQTLLLSHCGIPK